MVILQGFQVAAEQVLRLTSGSDTGIWIFGFGSLIYRPGFEFSQAVDGYIKGYRRVFYQGSTDHRGTPQFPGRTVTLEPHDEAVTWGRAFLLAGDQQKQLETLKYLEWREKQYDVRKHVEVFQQGNDMVPLLTAMVYIASPDRGRNPNYLGPAPLEDIALQISRAVGPSGHNAEYLALLAQEMRKMGVEDKELFGLEALVQKYISNTSSHITQNHVTAVIEEYAEGVEAQTVAQ